MTQYLKCHRVQKLRLALMMIQGSELQAVVAVWTDSAETSALYLFTCSCLL